MADRDYVSEVADAVADGDARTIAALAVRMAAEIEALRREAARVAQLEQSERDRKAKRAQAKRDERFRRAAGGDVARLSHDVARHDATGCDPSPSSPTPPPTPPTHTPAGDARAHEAPTDAPVLDPDEQVAYAVYAQFVADAGPERRLAVREWLASLPKGRHRGYIATANRAMQTGIAADVVETAMREWVTEAPAEPSSALWREFVGRVWRGEVKNDRAKVNGTGPPAGAGAANGRGAGPLDRSAQRSAVVAQAAAGAMAAATSVGLPDE